MVAAKAAMIEIENAVAETAAQQRQQQQKLPQRSSSSSGSSSNNSGNAAAAVAAEAVAVFDCFVIRPDATTRT